MNIDVIDLELELLYRTRGEMRCFERTLLMIEVSISPHTKYNTEFSPPPVPSGLFAS